MNGDASAWLRYARENVATARLCLQSGLFNPSIQNAQQTVEKALKALCLHAGLTVKKTHSIAGLRHDLLQANQACPLDEGDCDLLDSVYLPSKYPLGSALPDFEPNENIASRCLLLAEQALSITSNAIGKESH